MVRDMARDALVSAYGGESMSHMRYLIFAEIAEKEGFPNVARLCKNHYKLSKDLKEGLKVAAGAPFGLEIRLKILIFPLWVRFSR